MHKRLDVPRMPPESLEVEYYKSFARLSEERARDIRRIAALERTRLEERLREQEPTIRAHLAEVERLRSGYERLKAQSDQLKANNRQLKSELAAAKAEVKALKRAQDRIAASRAHRLAAAYVRQASGGSLVGRTLRLLRLCAQPLDQARRMLKSQRIAGER